VAALSVIITAARPVAVVGEKLEHKIEQLRSFCDFGFWHWFDGFR
jgi:ribosomal protein S3